jgi:hypothetical protein
MTARAGGATVRRGRLAAIDLPDFGMPERTPELSPAIYVGAPGAPA